MWLEFLNVSRSALTPSPVRLILKTGDDLRQDMITLKVLSLFDKVKVKVQSAAGGLSR